MNYSYNFMRIRNCVICLLLSGIALMFTACADPKSEVNDNESSSEQLDLQNEPDEAENKSEKENTDEDLTDGKSLNVDFDDLKKRNPDIVAWLTVPGTDIDTPVLYKEDDDFFYMSHDINKENSEDGAVYIDRYCFTDMCDFNTIIHGSKTLFGDIINYENPDFFDKNDTFYIYLPDNVLTYTVWATFRRENNSMVRAYNLADGVGCRAFLEDVYNGRYVGKQIREGWYELNEYNFLVTLTIDDEQSNDQLVVIGALTNDAAGTIDRTVIEQLDLGPSLLD